MKRNWKFLLIAMVVLNLTIKVYAQNMTTISKKDSLRQYYVNLAKSNRAEDQITLYKGLTELSNTKKEEDIELAIQVYDRVNQTAKADSLVEIATKRFPKGRLAMVHAYNNIVSNKGTGDEKAKKYKKWIREFPEPLTNPDIVYDYARSEVAGCYAQENNVREYRAWLSKIKVPVYRCIVENADAKIFLAKKDTITAEELMKDGVETARLTYEKSGNPQQAKDDYLTYASELAVILNKEKKYDESMHYAEIAYQGASDKNNLSIKQSYALALSANGRAKEAMPLMEAIIKQGKGSDALKVRFKSDYIKVKGSDAGFDDLMISFNEDLKENTQQAVSKEMIDLPAPMFTLQDLNGNTLSLADLKGKVVIVDLWATWCVPCKASFPAMQMAVNKYKNDPDVKFLFIHTWERSATAAKDAGEYMAANNYNFQVLMDTKDPITKTNKVVQSFNVRGIPAKFVIDKNGRIRFHITGFDGGNDAAVEELSAMIEMARKSS